MKKVISVLIFLFILIGLVMIPWHPDYSANPEGLSESPTPAENQASSGFLNNLPDYQGSIWITVNDDTPNFLPEDYQTDCFEQYSPLDSLGRAGTAFAHLSKEMMPDAPRESLGPVTPSGWHTVRYDDLIEDHYLYNRCHLIAYQLTGQNALSENLITGTRYFNVEGMLPLENEVASFLRQNEFSLLYRVTPVYHESDLLAQGVLIEASSVEDFGISFSLCRFVYNIQPGIQIDYSTGDSSRTETASNTPTPEISPSPTPTIGTIPADTTYVININTLRFHLPECESVWEMSEKNRMFSTQTRDELLADGFLPCGRCLPKESARQK